jgi:hypothetical protein
MISILFAFTYKLLSSYAGQGMATTFADGDDTSYSHPSYASE